MGQLQEQVHLIKSNQDSQFLQGASQHPFRNSWQNVLISCWNSDSAGDIHNKVEAKQLENHRMPEVRRCLRRSSRATQSWLPRTTSRHLLNIWVIEMTKFNKHEGAKLTNRFQQVCFLIFFLFINIFYFERK